ncbi:alpha-N-acetylgalactosaminidase-like isoform X2 [Hyposmocoma kahamanoa]|nr:alpha-N-acetylgalactosaminidase-like isoform X2 [Hyposmocoma kahamanoa]XP_026316103.1 alpha-N-acetylgalactosaminidase-like isoform X2 [Hyposmocoma kahamanoa]XP_026316104.1 alpha-N-acetylgalactosaminidase-like isoform X2 [Hyposmocoma kahamanoa]
MLTSHRLLHAYIALLILDNGWLLDNGLAKLPPMGWMSWGWYMCADNCTHNPNKCLDEKLILSVADAFYTEGYQEAGYEYIIIDDCWSERTRDEFGSLVPDRKRFPRGMKYIADYIHKRGLKFGMYTNIAYDTCMRYPGSRGYFEKDAKLFASWDVDYLKVDGCFVAESYLDHAYIDLGKALNETGRPMVYSCSWPYYKLFIHKHAANYSAVLPYCNLWRNYHDIMPAFGNIYYTLKFYEKNYENLYKFHGPGHWNDPDMLMLGTHSLTPGMSRIQVAVYAMLSAPWIISCDMNMVTPFDKSLLLNMNLIAVAQDPLGIMAKPYQVSRLTLWVKPHMPMKGDKYHSFSFTFVNFEDKFQYVTLPLSKYGISTNESYHVLDVFAGKFVLNVTRKDSIEVDVPPVDAVMYTLYPL